MTDQAATSVTVNFELTPEQWVQASLEHYGKQTVNREAVRRLRLVFGALVVAVAALITISGARGTATVIWLLAGGSVLPFFSRLVRSGQRRQLRRYAEVGIANGTFGPHRIELGPEGMSDSTAAYERLTRWSAIERVEKGESAFMVYVGPNAFLPIPHSAFQDADLVRRFDDAFDRLRTGKDGAEAGPAPSTSGP